MTTRRQIILTLFTTAYLASVILTDISFTGYWTDIIFSILLVSIGLLTVFKHTSRKTWLNTSLKTLTIIYSVMVFGLGGLNLINPFTWNTFKMKSFYLEEIDGRIFNAYFKPVGAYSGGEGVLWITESPKLLPFIEIEKHYNGTVLWDFRITEWEGDPVDQAEIVKNYILDEVIEKEINK